MIKRLLKLVVVIFVVGAPAIAGAHTYFVGLTSLVNNHEKQQIEVIHQFTAHDVENAIAEITQESFSPEHRAYEEYIQLYFERHFSLSDSNQDIKLTWVGIEVKRGKLFVYQEAKFKKYLTGILVKNDILVDTYSKQVNTLNFKDTQIKGSLTFTDNQKIASIKGIK